MVMLNRALSVVIIVSDKESSMISILPEVIHHISSSKAMLKRVIETAKQLGAAHIHLVYCSNNDDSSRKQYHQKDTHLNLVFYDKQYGVVYAIQKILTYLQDKEDILILYSDIPLISLNTLHRLIAIRPQGGISLITVILNNPKGYRRVLRIKNEIVGIVEHKYASKEEQQIKEISTGIIFSNVKDINRWLKKLTNSNSMQGECYLTDIIALAWRDGCKIKAIQPNCKTEVKNVTDQIQLVYLNRLFQKEQANRLLLSGVKLSDPKRFDLRGELRHGQDIFIDINVILEGIIILGNRVTIENGCVLKNVIIGDDVIIRPYTVIEDSSIEARSTIGPFAHLRNDSKLEEDVHIGNFVEIKHTHLGKGSKAGHLSYLGDADIGTQVNIGAGTITCNYDGVKKHKTYIRDDVFIGSGSQLVAPVTIGCGATIGAGTTVTHDVAEKEIIISRIRQFSISNRKKMINKKN